jgi:charged multivesicular body protein 2A
MGDEDDEEETDAVVSQVLDELGLQLTDQMTGLPVASGSLTVPAGKEAKTAVPSGPISDADADLQARLDNLRKD